LKSKTELRSQIRSWSAFAVVETFASQIGSWKGAIKAHKGFCDKLLWFSKIPIPFKNELHDVTTNLLNLHVLAVVYLYVSWGASKELVRMIGEKKPLLDLPS
jgi:hypothetical protein